MEKFMTVNIHCSKLEREDDTVAEDPYFYTNPNYILKTLLEEL